MQAASQFKANWLNSLAGFRLETLQSELNATGRHE